MSCHTTACSDCTRKCLLVHRKKTTLSSLVTSFFKIMIGGHYNKVLLLPPKFAPTVSALIHKRTILEDSSGCQWEVTVSNLNGSFALQKGWHAFSVHHKLEIGDLLVFDYIIGSHFFVRIYKRTACEKIDFSEDRNQRKRARATEKYTAKGGQCRITARDSMNKHGSSTSIISGAYVETSQSQCEENDPEKLIILAALNHEDCSGRPQAVPKAKCLEEPYYMIDRDLVDEAREDRCPVLDLSYFEMFENKSGTDTSKKITVGDERYPRHSDASVIPQIEDLLVNKVPVDEEVAKRVVPCDAPVLPQIGDLLVNEDQVDEEVANRVVPCDTSVLPQIEHLVVKKDPVDEEVAKRAVPCDASDLELVGENNTFHMMDKIEIVSDKISYNSKIAEHLLTTAAESGKNRGNSSNSSNGKFKRCPIAEEEGKAQLKSESEIDQLMLSPKESTSLSDGIQSAQLKLNGKCGKTNVPVAIHLGRNMNIVKQETLGIAPELCSDDETIQDIYGRLQQVMKADCGKRSDVRVREKTICSAKTETLDIVPISSPIAASFSCVIAASSQSFLELPTCFSLPTSSTQRYKKARKVVVLRDPDMRMWPVLYHETSGFKILAAGWEAFCKANSVQPGDKCVFGVENGKKSVFGVDILRK